MKSKYIGLKDIKKEPRETELLFGFDISYWWSAINELL
jgi:hypothetical protein